jgi:hypothetical protein
MTWSRQPLAPLAAGHDAVVEFTRAVIDQALGRQVAIVLPAARAGPFSVAVPAPGAAGGSGSSQPPAGAGTPSLVTSSTAGAAASSVMLDVVAVGMSSLRLLAAAAQAQGRDVLIRLTLRNESAAAVTLVASPTLGSVPRPLSPPVLFGPGATEVLTVPVQNAPTVTLALQLRVFALADPAVQTLLQGTLTVTPMLQPVVSAATPTATLAPRVPGLELRVSRTLTVDASPGSLAVDLEASAGTEVVLGCPVTLAIESVTTESLVSSRPAGSVLGGSGGLGAPVSTQYVVERRAAQAALRLRAPLLTWVEPGTRAVGVGCDLGAATLSLDTRDSDGQLAATELARQLRAALSSHVAQRVAGARLELAPRLSLVGALRPGETVTEVSLQQATAEVLAATSSSPEPVLAVAMTLVGNARTRGALQNFVGTDSFGAVVSGAVLRAVAAFRWRVGDHPRILLGRPNETEYTDNGTRVVLLVYPRMLQTSLVDAGGATVAALRVAGPRTYGTSTGIFTFLMTDAVASTKSHAEDHVLLGGLGDFEIASVLRKDTLQPASDKERQALEVPEELKQVLLHWTFSMSAVGAPAPVADANVEAFLQAMRSGVTQHLSRPFAASHSVVLSLRHANAVDDLLLSRGSLTL